MINKIDGYLLTTSINCKYLVEVKPFLAAKSVDMLGYVKPIQKDLDPEAYVIHIGTNEFEKWRAARASVGGMGDVLA